MAILLAKYEDFCRKCYERVYKNDKVFWDKENGIMHYKCRFKK